MFFRLTGNISYPLMIYFLLAIVYSARLHMWGTIPFLLLFFFGFGYMGVMSLLQTASGKRLSALWRPAENFARRAVNLATVCKVETSGAQGFVPAQFTNVIVTVGGQTPLDIQLTVGNATWKRCRAVGEM